MRLIDNVKTEFSRLWTIRLSIAFSVLTAIATVIQANAAALNPYFLLVLCILFNSILIPLVRIIKQDKPEDPEAKDG